MMDADVEVRCNAGYGKSPPAVNSRNGYRLREWDTRRNRRAGDPEAPQAGGPAPTCPWYRASTKLAGPSPAPDMLSPRKDPVKARPRARRCGDAASATLTLIFHGKTPAPIRRRGRTDQRLCCGPSSCSPADYPCKILSGG